MAAIGAAILWSQPATATAATAVGYACILGASFRDERSLPAARCRGNDVGPEIDMFHCSFAHLCVVFAQHSVDSDFGGLDFGSCSSEEV